MFIEISPSWHFKQFAIQMTLSWCVKKTCCKRICYNVSWTKHTYVHALAPMESTKLDSICAWKALPTINYRLSRPKRTCFWLSKVGFPTWNGTHTIHDQEVNKFCAYRREINLSMTSKSLWALNSNALSTSFEQINTLFLTLW